MTHNELFYARSTSKTLSIKICSYVQKWISLIKSYACLLSLKHISVSLFVKCFVRWIHFLKFYFGAITIIPKCACFYISPVCRTVGFLKSNKPLRRVETCGPGLRSAPQNKILPNKPTLISNFCLFDLSKLFMLWGPGVMFSL